MALFYIYDAQLAYYLKIIDPPEVLEADIAGVGHVLSVNFQMLLQLPGILEHLDKILIHIYKHT